MPLTSIFLFKLNNSGYQHAMKAGIWLDISDSTTNHQLPTNKQCLQRFSWINKAKKNNNNKKMIWYSIWANIWSLNTQYGLSGNELKMLWPVGPFESLQIMRAVDKHRPFVQLLYLWMSSISAFPFIPSRMEAEEGPLRRRPFKTTATQSWSFC